MPPTNSNPSNYLIKMIQSLQTQITKLGQQGSFATSGANAGVPVTIVMGNNPNDPVSPTTTYPNMTTTDNNGAVRAVVGQLNDTDYGFEVQDPNGVKQQIWPVSSDFNYSNLTTTSSTPATIAGSPSVDCYIGSSGDAVVTISGQIYNESADDATMTATLYVDGSPTDCYISGYGTNYATGSQVARLLDLIGTVTPNVDHTFSFEYQTTDGTAAFYGMGLIVQPL